MFSNFMGVDTFERRRYVSVCLSMVTWKKTVIRDRVREMRILLSPELKKLSN